MLLRSIETFCFSAARLSFSLLSVAAREEVEREKERKCVYY